MRRRTVLGFLERMLLGAAMSVVVFVVEGRLKRALRRREPKGAA